MRFQRCREAVGILADERPGERPSRVVAIGRGSDHGKVLVRWQQLMFGELGEQDWYKKVPFCQFAICFRKLVCGIAQEAYRDDSKQSNFVTVPKIRDSPNMNFVTVRIFRDITLA